MEDVPDPQVPERVRRRTYTAKYKADGLAAYDACDREAKGALMRRDGWYTSLISAWREQRDKGALKALSRPAGAAPATAAEKEAARLRNPCCNIALVGSAPMEVASRVAPRYGRPVGKEYSRVSSERAREGQEVDPGVSPYPPRYLLPISSVQQDGGVLTGRLPA
jgi:transposase